jgi:hypothetical protein
MCAVVVAQGETVGRFVEEDSVETIVHLMCAEKQCLRSGDLKVAIRDW